MHCRFVKESRRSSAVLLEATRDRPQMKFLENHHLHTSTMAGVSRSRLADLLKVLALLQSNHTTYSLPDDVPGSMPHLQPHLQSDMRAHG